MKGTRFYLNLKNKQFCHLLINNNNKNKINNNNNKFNHLEWLLCLLKINKNYFNSRIK